MSESQQKRKRVEVMSLWMKHAFSLASMLGGTTLVFGTVMLMNAYEEPPKEVSREAQVDFHVEKKPPPKKERPKPKPKAQSKRVSNAAAAPSPDLSSGISAPSFALPGFDMGTLGEDLNEKLLGDTNKKLTSMAGAACDEPPKPMRRAKPDFPASARSKGVSGRVKLSVRIGTDGRVDTVKVLESTPPGVFEEVAKKAMQDWEFSPCVYESEAVVGWVTQSMVFELGKKS